MFPIKFSLESFQIWYMDSLYHANQYVGNYMHFCVFFSQYFYFEKFGLEI